MWVLFIPFSIDFYWRGNMFIIVIGSNWIQHDTRRRNIHTIRCCSCIILVVIFFSFFLLSFDYELEREEIHFVRRIVCEWKTTGHRSLYSHTYRRLHPLDDCQIYFQLICLLWRGVASIMITITIIKRTTAPPCRWAETISYYLLSHKLDIIDLIYFNLI